MAGCVSSNNAAASRQPNYVNAQIYHSPPPGDMFGSDDLPPTVGGPQ